MAKKYFGTDKDVIDKVLKMSNRYDFKVKAVLKDIPANSHLDFDILAPYANLKNFGYKDDNWLRNNCITYVQLQKNVPYKVLISFGFHKLSKLFVESGSTIDHSLGSLVIGTKVDVFLNDYLALMFVLDSSVYSFGMEIGRASCRERV